MDSEESRPKRQKRESSYKAKAFEKFKQLKSGQRNRYEEEEVDNVYDLVEEKEYVKKVLGRQEDDWIVDDDGSGYVEDGREIFDDDLDQQSISAASSSKSRGLKRKKKAVSENAGKGNLQYMLTNMPTKKKEEKDLKNDDILSELLEEIDDSPSTPILKPKPMAFCSAKKAEQDYMRSFETIKKSPAPIKKTPLKTTVLNEIKSTNTSASTDLKGIRSINTPVSANLNQTKPNNSTVSRKTTETLEEELDTVETPKSVEPTDNHETESETDVSNPQTPQGDISTSCFDDDLDLTLVEELESQSNLEQNKENQNVSEFELMKDWIATDFEQENFDITDNNEITEIVEAKNVFRFFWWDAFEDASKQPGTVLLFGKTYSEEAKNYVSCCVVVKNIDRKLYFLPRQNEEGTDKQVTSQDVYNEIRDEIMKARQVKEFKARPVTKKYSFDPSIPVESEYIEVRYSAKCNGVSSTAEGKTFSKVFGTETSYLEILLMERKIKGPCWLDISNAEPVTNTISWCKIEVNCNKVNDIVITQSTKPLPPPPLVVTTINMRQVVDVKSGKNEIVMLSCVTNTKYAVDKQAPSIPFNNHFCVFMVPKGQIAPLNLYKLLSNYKATSVQKMDTEKALLNYFIVQFSKLDPDLVVGHDLQGYQINILSERLMLYQNSNFSKFSRVKRTVADKRKLDRELFAGRLVCDIKISAKELIKSRSYELGTLCESVLKLKEGARLDLEPEDILKMFQNTDHILQLISMTMQDTSYMLKILYNLNIIPLALQITNIAGNVMSKTLLGGRSERNEFLLLHAFSERGYIVPDKIYKKRDDNARAESKSKRKKPTYSGGLVLDPKVGFYDHLVLLMDFNSLYPSIIQEYNICFTTMPTGLSEENIILPDKSLAAGILPTEIRKLVESRREVKKLMNTPDINSDLKMQYHIRQMALKLTANSMYGCLGFSNSRFYAKNLAALVTYKGREILTNTKDLVQAMNFDVIYGDTDSIMINTNITDYDQVFKIGSRIKQEINKLYRQVELDIDGVFKYLLLLKKKKYAAVTITKGKNGDLKTEIEYKGLDIVRRDWSQLACEAGKFILKQILSDQSLDDRICNIHAHLTKLRVDLEENRVPLSLLIITKQLTKAPNLYLDKNSLPHVLVALRYNKEAGGHYKAGDTVSYVICEDGTQNSATQRAYHIEELKNSKGTLKIDTKYYLSQQIHPVVSRICEPIEGTDSAQIAATLGLDPSNFKQKTVYQEVVNVNVTTAEVKFRNVDKFVYKCYNCEFEREIDGASDESFYILNKCSSQCNATPEIALNSLKNQLISTIGFYLEKYYDCVMYCEDPLCTNETSTLPMLFSGKHPVCTLCKNSVLLQKYTASNLNSQLEYYHHIFSLNNYPKKAILGSQVIRAYNELAEIVQKRLRQSAYREVNLKEMFSFFHDNEKIESPTITEVEAEEEEFDMDEF